MKERQLASTAHPISFLMVLTSDHISPATGLTPVVTISKDGGAFATPAGAVTELSSGWYTLAGNATDRGTLGQFILHATGTASDPQDEKYDIVAYDPYNVANLGLTNLDAAISTRSTYAGTDTTGTTTLLARVGVAGAGLTALGDARIANLDALVSTRLATAGYTAPGVAQTGDAFARLGAPVGASISADLQNATSGAGCVVTATVAPSKTVVTVSGLSQTNNYIGMYLEFRTGPNAFTRQAITNQASSGSDVQLTFGTVGFGATPGVGNIGLAA